jgi:DNA-binding transcriptional ArsR family regulator
MVEKYLNIDLNDENAGKVAEVISNKTCKKILNLIAEKEMSESDISNELKLPLNTIDYNVKKLLSVGLIEKSKNFFWSVKGKKIETYKLANKKIIISTKSKFRGFLPAALICGVVAVGLRYLFNYVNSRQIVNVEYNALEKTGALMTNVASPAVSDVASPAVLEAASGASNLIANQQTSFFNTLFNGNPVWAWFLFGALSGIFIIWVWNSKFIRDLKGGK